MRNTKICLNLRLQIFGRIKSNEKEEKIISKFSGKCDCYDILIYGYTEDELKNNVKIYIGDAKTPFKIECIQDLIPYYPYIITYLGFNGAEKKTVIHLSSESYVDYEEREIMQSYLKQILREYNKCKKKKEDFNINDVTSKVCWNYVNEDVIREIAARVKEKGKKADISDLHLDIREYYRKELVNEMLENGLNPANYGYKRFVEGR